MTSSYFKCCAVPSCDSASISTPDKIFVVVPNNQKMREKWFSLAGRKDAQYLSTKTRFYFCEDHFDLLNDMKNYTEYHIMGKVGQVRMKPNCIPSKFACHENKRKWTCDLKDSQESRKLKKQRRKLINNEEKTGQSTFVGECSCTSSDVQVNGEYMVKHLCKENKDQSDSTSITSNDKTLLNSHEIITQHCILNTIKKIEQKPLQHIGVLNTYYFIIDLIKNKLGISKHILLLCLNIINLNKKFNQVIDDFGMTASDIKKTFFKNVPKIARILRQGIISLDREIIKKTLPSTFKHVHDDVCYIITCVEIQIQKPRDKIAQVLTYSESRKSYTIKYLISFTPNGLINYISPGFGGRISDTHIVELSNLVTSLKCGDIIMAHYKFQNIKSFLKISGITLVKPRNEIDEKFNLKIPIEKMMQRLQQFDMLKSDACIEIELLKILDDIVTIVCALINMQDCFLK